jgi:hypothetical protein
MVTFPHLEFVQAFSQARKAARRGDVRAAERWLTLSERYMQIYRRYNEGYAEGNRFEREMSEMLVREIPGFVGRR